MEMRIGLGEGMGSVETSGGGGHGVPPLRRFAFDPDFAVGEYFFFPDGNCFL
jgi:hypothetical protein